MSKAVQYEQKMFELEYFEGVNDWNVITLVTQTKNKSIDKDDETFKTVLRGVQTRMSDKILTTMYGAMRTDD